MKWTIKRSKWLRGIGNVGSRLLVSDGRQCCIGMACSQLGATNDQLLNLTTIAIATYRAGMPDFKELFSQTRERYWVRQAYGINDDYNMDDATRESQLKSLALANGHEFEFID